MVKIGVLGAGTWGMALARMLSNMGYDVMVWSALPKEVEEYSRTRRHPNLPGMIIPDSIVFTKNIEEVCTGKNSEDGGSVYPGWAGDCRCCKGN